MRAEERAQQLQREKAEAAAIVAAECEAMLKGADVDGTAAAAAAAAISEDGSTEVPPRYMLSGDTASVVAPVLQLGAVVDSGGNKTPTVDAPAAFEPEGPPSIVDLGAIAFARKRAESDARKRSASMSHMSDRDSNTSGVGSGAPGHSVNHAISTPLLTQALVDSEVEAGAASVAVKADPVASASTRSVSPESTSSWIEVERADVVCCVTPS